MNTRFDLFKDLLDVVQFNNGFSVCKESSWIPVLLSRLHLVAILTDFVSVYEFWLEYPIHIVILMLHLVWRCYLTYSYRHSVISIVHTICFFCWILKSNLKLTHIIAMNRFSEKLEETKAKGKALLSLWFMSEFSE